MSLVNFSNFPRAKIDSDSSSWYSYAAGHKVGPTSLDLFDSYDELDHNVSKNLYWLNKPEFLPRFVMPMVLQKYRIVCDIRGFSPNSVKTDFTTLGRHIIVHAREDVKLDEGDFFKKELKRTFEYPKEAITDKMVCFVTSHGQLVMEFPLKETATHLDADLFPKVVDNPIGVGKICTLTFAVPAGISMERVHVAVKDRDVIIKAEDKFENNDPTARFYFYKRTTLPENTDFTKLNCKWDQHKLTIEAPLDINYCTSYKKVPIVMVKE
jgi:HSP20 family molecular chaperone IbpA